MPALRQNGILVYFAAFKGHIGLYPPVAGNARIRRAIAPYAGEKGNLRFPFDRPIPYELIARRAWRRRVAQLEHWTHTTLRIVEAPHIEDFRSSDTDAPVHGFDRHHADTARRLPRTHDCRGEHA